MRSRQTYLLLLLGLWSSKVCKDGYKFSEIWGGRGSDQAHHDSKARQGNDGTSSKRPLVMTIPAEAFDEVRKQGKFYLYQNAVLLCKENEDNPVKNPILQDEEDVH